MLTKALLKTQQVIENLEPGPFSNLGLLEDKLLLKRQFCGTNDDKDFRVSKGH